MGHFSNLSEPSAEHLKSLCQENHSWCVVCGDANPLGLKVRFTLQPDGSVEGRFAGGHVFQSYDGVLHGGMIAALLDGAMTNCMFAHGHRAVTGELIVRYRKTVEAGEPVVMRAWLEQSNLGLYQLRAELSQNDSIKVIAAAKFMDKPDHKVSEARNKLPE